MVKVKKTSKGFNLTGEVGNEVKVSKIVQFLCSKTSEVEYIGRMVNKEREMATYVEYDGKIYYDESWSGHFREHTIEFRNFLGQMDDLQPFEEYEYYIDHSSQAHNGECFFYYFKKNEIEEAKKMLEELGGTADVKSVKSHKIVKL